MIEISIIPTKNKGIKGKLLKSVCKYVLKKMGIIKKGNHLFLDIAFISREKMRELNKKYRGIDRATTSLCFPFFERANSSPVHLGQILLCEEVIRKRGELHGVGFERELMDVLIHSLLHLIGYDHKKDKEREKMRNIQREFLKELMRRFS